MSVPKKVISLGMPLDEWTYKSCTAHVAVGGDWATIYSIESIERNKGHASTLLKSMQSHYSRQNKKFGSSIALSLEMKHLLEKFAIPEYS